MTTTQRTGGALGGASAQVEGADLLITVPASVPEFARPWLPLTASLALADGLREVARVPAEVAWPDTVTLQRAMCGGAGGSFRTARVETTDAAVSARLSLTASSLDLPAGWTSVWAEGGKAEPEPIVAAYVAALHDRVEQLLARDPQLRADYRARCVTLGRLVHLDGRHGIVDGITDDAALLATVDGEQRRLDADQVPPL
jgi:BirA family biotin operon repressor/biotin-[acetyl-CoA-carboxylase] ligase